MVKQLKTYFIGNALEGAENIFDKSRIELTYKLSLIFIFMYSMHIALAFKLSIAPIYNLVHLFGLFGFGSVLVIFRRNGSAYMAGLTLWGTMSLICVTMVCIGSGRPAIPDFLWFLFCIIGAFLLSGRKWGTISAVFFIAMSSFIILNYGHDLNLIGMGYKTGVYEIDVLNKGYESLGDPTFMAIPMVIIVVMLAHFIKTRNETQSILFSQKREIEEVHHELTSSINYAKRIQSAILPPANLVKQHLPDSFVLYKPKDIVAGDFYWLEPIGKTILIAAADCTGHGVPGAMVSVVCNNSLNRSAREFGLLDPGQILTKTRELVIQEFEKSEEEVKDGMDIALCALDGNTLKYAGAHNPLWIVREGAILETKADKQPIGKHFNEKPFTTHEIQLQKGDTIYLFSDGFVDQFGGEKGKKLKAKAFKEMLLSIQGKTMVEQHRYTNSFFEKWREGYEQVDDVCLIGINHL